MRINFRGDSFEVLTVAGDEPSDGPPDGAGRPREAGPGSCLYKGGFCLKAPNAHAMAYSFVGANHSDSLEFDSKVPGVTFYSGATRGSGGSGAVERFSKIAYRDLYEGIDVVFRFNDSGNIEYDLEVSGGSYRDFGIRAEGAGGESVVDGALRAGVPGGEIIHSRPKVTGDTGIGAGFDLQGNVARIALDSAPPTAPYVIDPEIIFASYEHPGDFDANLRTVNDSEGSIYVAGYSRPVSSTTAYMQARVTKYTRQDVASPVPSWTKVFGGTGADLSLEIAISPDEKSIVVVGITTSDDFITEIEEDQGGPLAVPPIYGTMKGRQDAFVVRLVSGANVSDHTDDGKIDFATYFGGDGIPRGGLVDAADEAAQGVAIVNTGARDEVLISGFTNSESGFPLKGAFQPTYGGGQHDAFFARISPDHLGPNRLVFSSYLGGSGSPGEDDEYYDVRIATDDITNHFWVLGRTSSTDFPVSASDVPQTSYGGGPSDFFLARFSDNGQTPAGITYLGADGAEINEGGTNYGEVSTDLSIKDSKATITGFSVEPATLQLPTTPGAIQPAPQGDRDAYVAQLSPFLGSGLALDYGTYLGGSERDFAGGLAVDSSARLVVGGQTYSSDFPLTDPLGSGPCNDQAWLAVIDKARPTLRFSGCFGGSDVDTVEGVRLAQGVSGEVVEAVGWTESEDFPTDSGTPPYAPFDSNFGSNPDAMVVRVDLSDVLYNYIAFSSNRDAPLGDPNRFGIYVMSDDGKNSQAVPSSGTGTRTFEQPAISPNGNRIAYVSAPTVGGQWDLWVMDKDGANQCQLTSSTAAEQRPVFSPDGLHIAYSSDASGNREIHSVEFDQVSATCPGILTETQLTNVSPRYADSPTYSPVPGCIAYMAGNGISTDIEFTGGSCPAGPITTDGLFNSYPAWSPSTASSQGGKVAFASMRMAIGETDPPPDVRLWVWDSADETITGPLTSAPGTGTGASAPAWSPDGARLMAYASIGSGDPDVWTMNPDGTGQVNLIDIYSTGETATDWWPSYGRGSVP